MRAYSRNRRQWPFRLLTAATVTLAVACSSAPAATTFHPGATSESADAGTSSSPPAQLANQSLAWPPFGADVHVRMTAWLPSRQHEIPAVIAAKDFLLAFLYAEYRSNNDDRWTGYTSGQVVQALQANLSQPDITTESFTGTVSFTHMKAFPDPSRKAAVDVSECFNNADAKNTSAATGEPLKDQGPANQHYYRNTDVLVKGHARRWRVVAIYPVIDYPQAKECKP